MSNAEAKEDKYDNLNYMLYFQCQQEIQRKHVWYVFIFKFCIHSNHLFYNNNQ